jgi:hypothetical protein
MLALAGMGLYALNRGNPLYEQLDDWDRDLHWHFYVPTKGYYDFVSKNGREPKTPAEAKDAYLHLRYPKIWEVGALSSIAERTLQATLDREPVQGAKNVLRAIGQVFNLEYLPQVISPAVEAFANFDRFRNRPIESRAMADLEPWARAHPTTSPTMRKLGEATRDLPEAMQISPAKAEHLIRGYFNAWGMGALAMIDGALYDDKPERRLDEYPVLRRFYSQEPAKHTKHVADLYEFIGDTTALRRTMRAMSKTYRPELVDELEKRDENEFYRQMQRTDRKMRRFSTELKDVLSAPELTDLQRIATQRAEATAGTPGNPGHRTVTNAKLSGAWMVEPKLRRMLLDDITEERNEFAREVMEDVRRRQKERKAGPQPLPNTTPPDMPRPAPTPTVPVPPPPSRPPGLARGGVVTPGHLVGPDPAGPDEGFAPLQAGEFVVNANSASRFRDILEAINAGALDGVNLGRNPSDRSGYMQLTQ